MFGLTDDDLGWIAAILVVLVGAAVLGLRAKRHTAEGAAQGRAEGIKEERERQAREAKEKRERANAAKRERRAQREPSPKIIVIEREKTREVVFVQCRFCSGKTHAGQSKCEHCGAPL